MRVLVWHFPKRLEQNQIDFQNLHKLSVKRAPAGKNEWCTLSVLVCVTKNYLKKILRGLNGAL